MASSIYFLHLFHAITVYRYRYYQIQHLFILYVICELKIYPIGRFLFVDMCCKMLAICGVTQLITGIQISWLRKCFFWPTCFKPGTKYVLAVLQDNLRDISLVSLAAGAGRSRVAAQSDTWTSGCVPGNQAKSHVCIEYTWTHCALYVEIHDIEVLDCIIVKNLCVSRIPFLKLIFWTSMAGRL